MTQITDQAVGDILSAARPAVEAVEAHYVEQLAAANARADNAEHDRDQARRELADHMATHTPDPEPEPEVPLPVIGMSAEASTWDARVREVGPGLGARRIFADLADGGMDQMNLVDAAHAADLLPVISYKVGGNISGALSGVYDAAARTAATALASRGPAVVVIWHEPNPDITASQFRQLNSRLIPIFKAAGLTVGCFLNGWLLDRQVATFMGYTDATLLDLWDFVGIDTYHPGTETNPSTTVFPGHRLPALRQALAAVGQGDKPTAVGEYNGYTAEAIRVSGNIFLEDDSLLFACMWNTTGGKGKVLTGDRLTAFRETVAAAQA